MSSTQPDAMSPSRSDTLPNVLLRGGPAFLPEEERTRYVGDVDSKLKLLFGNAYEHFQPTGETVDHEGVRLRVFEWSLRTYVAE
ncbi:DUF5988 family protein [Streptomyces sp. NPDC001652]|uniref:DUF5988 family protein n=1 Tax=Streptomyces sp. NPDC001652 TaxID=3154393 RepID=UPI00332815C5